MVRVLRNPIEVAHSLKNARIKYYGNPNSWWSLITPNYDELKELPYHLQIPLQMKTLQDDFERNLQLLPKENQIDVKLEDMLSNPSGFVKQVSDKLQALKHGDYLDNNIGDLPTRFDYPLRENDDNELTKNTKQIFGL